MDTRPFPDNVGIRSTPLGVDEVYPAQIVGVNGKCTIPSGVTAVSMNVTIISPTAGSFLTVFPSDKVRPLAANLNWVAGQAPTPNAVTAAVSVDGKVSFYNLSGSVNVAVDVVGYYELSTSGPAGPPGAPGAPGAPGSPALAPARVVWVATSGGDFTSVRAALTSITDNDAGHRYVIRVAPGTYAETSAGLDLKNYVDIEGSGQDVTEISCACGSATDPITNGSSAVLRATGPGIHSEIRFVTIVNTGGNTYSTGIWTDNSATGLVSLLYVTATAAGGTVEADGVFNRSSSPSMDNLTATATGGSNNNGVNNLSSSPSMDNVTAKATGGTNSIGVRDNASSPSMDNVTAIAVGGANNFGVYSIASSSLSIRNSSMTGSEGAISSLGSSTARVANSIISGPLSGGGYLCAATFDAVTLTVVSGVACPI